MTRKPYYFFSKCAMVFFYLFSQACNSDSVHEGLKAQKKFRTHFIAGRAMNAAIGMEGVKVFLVAQDQSARESVSDSSGAYRFNNVIPGSYLLRPEKEGLKFSPETREIEIVEKDLENIDFSCRDLFQNEMQKSGPGDEYLGPGMEFGNSVAIEGDYIIAGARKDGPGSAYIFQKTGENSWQETARINVDASRAEDEFGYAVALTRSIERYYAIVGSPWYDGQSGSSKDSGAAYVFMRTDSGSWTEDVFQLPNSAIQTGEGFGHSVDINDQYAVIGSPFVNNSRGGIYIYNRTDINVWSNPDDLMLEAPDAKEYDFFGGAVAIDGDHVIVGARHKTYISQYEGVVYIFTQTFLYNWEFSSKLVCPDGEVSDYFGWSVDIYGDTAVAGAPMKSEGGVERGAVYVFQKISDTAWGTFAKITAPDKGDGDQFGTSVALYGNYLIVGAHSKDLETGINIGAAYVFFREESGEWVYLRTLTPSDGMADDEFGFAVTLDENNAVIGSYREDTGGANAGSIYIY